MRKRKRYAVLLFAAVGCSYDWDSLDPRGGDGHTGGDAGSDATGGAPEGGGSSGTAGITTSGAAGTVAGSAGEVTAGSVGQAGTGQGGTTPVGGSGGQPTGGTSGEAGATVGGSESGGEAGTGGEATAGSGTTSGAAGQCSGAFCGGECIAVDSSVDHCGGCDRACSQLRVAELSCTNGVCDSTCQAGTANCSLPEAPAPDNGCETSIYTSVSNCGACDRACDTANVDGIRCSVGFCDSTCQTGSANCSQPAAPDPDDGCETITAEHPDCADCDPFEICRPGGCSAPCDAAGLEALLVRGTTDTAADLVVIDWFSSTLGFDTVTSVDSADVTAAQADTFDLVVVASTAEGLDLFDVLAGVTAPVVSWEPYLHPYFGLTGPTVDFDFGIASNQTQVVVDPCHPASAALVGATAVFTEGTDLSWGVVIGSATVLATVDGAPGQAAAFVVEAGDPLYDGSPAPARRVGLFLHDSGPSLVTDDGARLALASICWAIDRL